MQPGSHSSVANQPTVVTTVCQTTLPSSGLMAYTSPPDVIPTIDSLENATSTSRLVDGICCHSVLPSSTDSASTSPFANPSRISFPVVTSILPTGPDTTVCQTKSVVSTFIACKVESDPAMTTV